MKCLAQSNLLRRMSPTTICAYLCYSMGSEFVTVQTQWDGTTNYSMIRVKVIKAPQYDLVDFEVNDNRIWGLWCNPQGEYNICSYSFVSTSGWISAAMEPPPDRCIVVENGCDPKQTYCSYIFHPGKFQRSVIDQALMVIFLFDTRMIYHSMIGPIFRCSVDQIFYPIRIYRYQY